MYKEGSRGVIVTQIQKKIGAYPDGIWGKLTTECLKHWQKEYGLTPDGIAGPATLSLMGIATAAEALSKQKKTYTIQHGGITLKKSKREITHIVVHCTATREGQPKTVDQIRSEHRQQGWSDIGYHYLVTLEGKTFIGRDVDIVGSHVKGHNQNTIGVAYVGGLENKPGVAIGQLKAKDTRTPAQKAELLSLLMDLRRLYPFAKIRGHRDFSPDLNHNGIIEPCEYIKECPSFDAKEEYKKI